MDRRTVWAILLMMVIAITPAIFIKRPPRPVTGAGSTADSTAGAPAAAPGSVGPAAVAAPGDTAARGAASADTLRAPGDTIAAAAAPVRTVRATSPLYRYGISTSGARLVEARLPYYRSIAPADSGATAQLLPPDSRLLGLTLVMGRDTIPLEGWTFTASTDSLDAAAGEPLRLTATRGAVGVDLEYRFAPDDYRIAVSGRVTGVGPNGGTL